MSIEQRLARALHDEADTRDVDVDRLYWATRDRIEAQPGRRRRTARTMLLAAAGTAALVAGVLVVGDLTKTDTTPGPVGQPVEGGVDDAFTCPEQRVFDWTRPETVTNDYFGASLHKGAAWQAAEHGAPRYEYEERGDRAVLRFGNADGSLATLSEFHRVDGAWVPRYSRVCNGRDGSILAPTEGELRLGRHAGEPPPLTQIGARQSAAAVLLDDRLYFDHIGLLRHRTILATVCRKPAGPAALPADRLCLLQSDGPGSLSRVIVPAGAVPVDLSRLFAPFDAAVDRVNPFGLWVVHDPADEVKLIAANRGDDPQLLSRELTHPRWPGDLHVLLARTDEVTSIEVWPTRGEPRRYSPAELEAR